MTGVEVEDRGRANEQKQEMFDEPVAADERHQREKKQKRQRGPVPAARLSTENRERHRSAQDRGEEHHEIAGLAEAEAAEERGERDKTVQREAPARGSP